jgi:hypothetical protein
MAIKFIVKPVGSFGVFAHEDGSDGCYSSDRSVGTYESEKTAELIAEALNEEEGRRALYASAVGIAQAKVGTGPNDVTKSIYAEQDIPNGHDKETI